MVRALTRCSLFVIARSVKVLYEYTNPRNDQWAPLVSEELHAVVLKARRRASVPAAGSWLRLASLSDASQTGVQNAERLDSAVIYDRDFDYDFFGFKARASVHAA